MLEWLTLLIKKFYVNCFFITADKLSADNGKDVPVCSAFIFRWIIFAKKIVISSLCSPSPITDGMP